VSISLTGDERAPAAARSYVRRHLDDTKVPEGVLVEDVELITSELVTNSVRAGATQIEVALSWRNGRLELTVDDDAGGWPNRTQPDHDGTSGRGLNIVGRLTDTWTVTRRGKGKRVTATWSERSLSHQSRRDERTVPIAHGDPEAAAQDRSIEMPRAGLAPGESEVVGPIANGLSNQDIARGTGPQHHFVKPSIRGAYRRISCDDPAHSRSLGGPGTASSGSRCRSRRHDRSRAASRPT
jgi:anti-sigma regulatory factor (Ser/Thr protein kinase)